MDQKDQKKPQLKIFVGRDDVVSTTPSKTTVTTISFSVLVVVVVVVVAVAVAVVVVVVVVVVGFRFEKSLLFRWPNLSLSIYRWIWHGTSSMR